MLTITQSIELTNLLRSVQKECEEAVITVKETHNPINVTLWTPAGKRGITFFMSNTSPKDKEPKYELHAQVYWDSIYTTSYDTMIDSFIAQLNNDYICNTLTGWPDYKLSGSMIGRN